MYLADRAGFQIASTISALYDVAPLEGHSRPKPEMVEYSDAILRFVGCSITRHILISPSFAVRVPEVFECRFVARNAKTEELLKMSALQE